eukprot:CAMPEP_0172745494 /NCGR_PEP_ID=MMETSP1074-20121228/138070_1 /TAXON_ID=2916 /ORGANISM="Ceratium fusus, Strain PA161109" /LENGTH=80 /DNA_ID=CAMNT_0013576679 /DNA_START=45 /DNA_END=283 /DNA_ORIENTATION=+
MLLEYKPPQPKDSNKMQVVIQGERVYLAAHDAVLVFCLKQTDAYPLLASMPLPSILVDSSPGATQLQLFEVLDKGHVVAG